MKQKRSGLGKIIFWVLLLILPFFIAKNYWDNLKSPVNPKGETKVFVISKGESINNIANRLHEAGFIRSEWIFKFEIKNLGQDSNIMPGDFKLSASMSLSNIIKNLTSNPIDRWVTLIEGWRNEEMAQELSEKLQIKSEKFIELAKQYEGYLFPDTYLFNEDVTEATIVQIMKANFDKKYNVNLKKQINSLGLTADQGVILASMVEREARSDEVRTEVASILLKRFNIGMGLNVDSTIQYALGYQKVEKSWWKRNLTREDLKINSAYNTYIHAGLPPTPICNPSLSSLKAVANADPSTPYLYYYHDSKGNSYYGKTLDEHSANVANHP